MAGGQVPANLAPIFQGASRATGVPAAVLAGIASVESNFGANRGPSSAGAVGLMQFEPGTAKGLGINPYNDRQAIYGAAKLLLQYGYRQNPTRALAAYNAGPGNYQAGLGYAGQVTSEARRVAGMLHGGGGQAGGALAFPGVPTGSQPALERIVPTFDQQGFNQAQGRYIVGSFLSHEQNPFDQGPKGADLGPNPLLASGVLTTKPPNPADFQGVKAVQAAQNSLQQLAGGTSLKVHPGSVPGYRGYVNPIAGATIGRTDMGVDASGLRPGAPIRAIGDSRVIGIAPNWYKGQPYIALRLLNGPARGKVYYVAEQIAPTVRAGQVVHAGDTIGRYAASGTGLELGWGTPTPGRTLAQATSGYAEGQVTPAGSSFRNFLGSL